MQASTLSSESSTDSFSFSNTENFSSNNENNDEKPNKPLKGGEGLLIGNNSKSVLSPMNDLRYMRSFAYSVERLKEEKFEGSVGVLYAK